MKYLVSIILFAIIFLLLLPSCHNDVDYAEVGTSWVYDNSKSSAIEDGEYIIRNMGEYETLIDTPLPTGCNVDFNKNNLVIAKGHDVNEYDDIEVSATVDGNAYIINVTLIRGQLIRPAVEAWCVVSVLPKIPDPTVRLNVKSSAY